MDAKYRPLVKTTKRFKLPQLIEAVRADRLAGRPFRIQRADAIRLGLGNRWGGDVLMQKQYLNLIGLYERTVTRALAPKMPRVLLSTFKADFRQIVSTEQDWANQYLDKIGSGITFQRIVTDALYQIGIAMVGISTPSDAAASGWHMTAGIPCIWRVDFEDFVFDMHARELGEVSYAGHRWRPPLYTIQESTLYSKHRKNLTASYDRPYNQQGDEKISTFQRQPLTSSMIEFMDRVDLWNIWIPDEGIIVTLESNDGGDPELSADGEPLRIQHYIGKHGGPYRYLALGIVPNNAMPRAPIQDQLDLHEATNAMLRKLVDQGDRQKEVIFTTGIADTDGNRLINASDGQVIRVDNANELVSKKWGGPDQGLFALMQELKNLWDWLSGNTSATAGLAPQSKTATQDKMLLQSANAGIADMQDTTINFMADTLDAWLWLCHNHPELRMQATPEIPGVPSELLQAQTVGPEERGQVPYEALRCKVDPYSLQRQTPQQRMQFLDSLLNQVAPLMPLLQQAGHTIDIEFWLQKKAEYGDSPDVQQMFRLQEPPPDSGTPDMATQQGPPETRTVDRVNRGTTTPTAQANMRQQLFSGNNPQPAELDKMMQPVG
jgi:hypothetical protein